MISLSVVVTKLNLEFVGQKKQSNMMLSGMSMNDLAQFTGPTIKKFEPLPRPLVRVLTSCLAKEMGSVLVLESTSSAASYHHFAHGACVFGCTLRSGDSVFPSTSMQLYLARLVFISVSSINQSVSRKSCCCFRLVCVSSYCWIFILSSIDCFLLNKTSSSLVLILFNNNVIEHHHIKTRLFFGGTGFLGFIGSISLLSIYGLTKTSSG